MSLRLSSGGEGNERRSGSSVGYFVFFFLFLALIAEASSPSADGGGVKGAAADCSEKERMRGRGEGFGGERCQLTVDCLEPMKTRMLEREKKEAGAHRLSQRAPCRWRPVQTEQKIDNRDANVGKRKRQDDEYFNVSI